MGLDSVELMIAFEEDFDIAIADDEAAAMRTPRHVTDFVYEKVRFRDWQPCPSQNAFYRLRRAAACAPASVRPETALADLLPERGRRSGWRRLGERVGLHHWPALQLPVRVAVTGFLATLGAAVVAGLLAHSWWIGIGTFLVAVWFVPRAIKPLATVFPFELRTIGDLARWLGTNRLPPAGGWTRENVRLAVRKIVREQLGLRDDFSDDADFVRDFGID